jgi:hypothetical protein
MRVHLLLENSLPKTVPEMPFIAIRDGRAGLPDPCYKDLQSVGWIFEQGVALL